MKILAIDTATEACSAAILSNESLLERFEVAPRRHAELILPMVDALLAESGLKLADLDALAFGRGPGAFTGVRIATGVIQGLAYGGRLPVIPVSTLAALAQGAADRAGHMLSAIDARMGEIYWCAFRQDTDNLVAPLTEEAVSRPAELIVKEDHAYYGIGTGWKSYERELTALLGEKYAGHDGEAYPRARDIVKLAAREYREGRTVPADKALPVYLRNRVTD